MNLIYRNIAKVVNEFNSKLNYIHAVVTNQEEKIRQTSEIATSALALRSIFRDIKGQEADDLYKQLATINEECSKIMSEIINIKAS
ncbi:hypothetical protein [Bacillus amyloliquefaciens]|uniref:hypothetical protein n=1 Tax=Bacillus amyloliquefaciens TaxID=1390 RepID=UPI000E223230|nr:hypothetical protein [Bacillus amyloliquefaciens]RDY83171.1 hypothetical protein C3733_20140 [Bacillus amyloliquefaciens]